MVVVIASGVPGNGGEGIVVGESGASARPHPFRVWSSGAEDSVGRRRWAVGGVGGLAECLEDIRLEALAIGEGDLLRLIGTILLPPPSESKSDRVSTLLGRYGSDGESEEIDDCDAR